MQTSKPFAAKISHIFVGILFWTGLISGCTCDFGLDSFGTSTSKKDDGGPIAVLFHLDGAMPDFTDEGVFFSEPGMSRDKFSKLMKKAKSDILVQEIIVHFSAFQSGFARLNEIGAVIQDTAKDKPVTCVLESADNKSYWMAAGNCPKIILAPAGGLDVIGLSMEGVYLKELLDKIGVQADMLAVGKYKSAAENVTRNDMSVDAREATESLLKDINERFTSTIAKGRKLDQNKVKTLIDEGPFTASQAKKHGLVDEVKSISSVIAELSDKYKGGVKSDYGKKPQKEMDFSDLMKLLSGGGENKKDDTEKIAIIPALGPINSGKNKGGMLSGNQAVYDFELIDNLMTAARDESVKAVVLRIDSPGGSALASDNIWEAVQILAKQKPVVASMGDVAASGGYYIASAADYVYADANTITGSIGVVGGKMVLGEGLNQIGVHSDSVKLGKNAGMLSPFQPFSDDERHVILTSMKSIYELFLNRVSKGRNLKVDDVRQIAEGRIWTGAQAKKFGLVDALGNLSEATDKARELGKAKGVKAILYPAPKTFMEILGEQLSGGADAKVQLLKEFDATRRALELGLLMKNERVLTFCPYIFSIN
ncbi:MAG: signal peptide peptidase SppA [Deltaproteobacteria bacterium]|nr:signal peptide peptidase SppA [Deltaproteobacteria bacterium]